MPKYILNSEHEFEYEDGTIIKRFDKEGFVILLFQNNFEFRLIKLSEYFGDSTKYIILTDQKGRGYLFDKYYLPRIPKDILHIMNIRPEVIQTILTLTSEEYDVVTSYLFLTGKP